MNGYSKILLLGVGIVVALLLVRCTPPELCTYGNVVKAWVDADENSQWDDGEQPLPGVQIIVNADAGADSTQGGITDDKGEAEAGIISMSCSASFSICAEAPPGYRLTTQDCHSGHFSTWFFDEPSVPEALLFGFAPDLWGEKSPVEATPGGQEEKRLNESLVVSDGQTKATYVGYEALPADWTTPDFDDSAWRYAVPYRHPAYPDPTTEGPFAGSGAQWLSYESNPAQLPDFNDPSLSTLIWTSTPTLPALKPRAMT